MILLALLCVAGLEKITRPKSEDDSTPRWLGRILLDVVVCTALFNVNLIRESWQKKAP